MEIFICVVFAMVISTTLAAPSSYQQCFSDSSFTSPLSTQLIVGQSIDFSVELFQEIFESTTSTNDNRNIIFSPPSIWSALMTLYFGANGHTAVQLSRVLRIGDAGKGNALAAYFDVKNKYKSLNNANYTMRVANKIYFDNNAATGTCIEMLKSEVERINIARDPESVRLLINKWVENQTNCKIKDLIPRGALTRTTRMVIANAAYFKGLWQHPFRPKFTEKANFFVRPTISTTVDMMRQEDTLPYAATSSLNCAAVELPYAGQDYSMIILLPKTTLEELVPKLTRQALDQLYNEMSPSLVRVVIPKLKSEETIELSNILRNLGIRDVFDNSAVDLSGFTSDDNSAVQSVLHKAFIEVNEEGTEAAAATSGITAYSLNHYESFLANRPFLYFVRSNVDNAILFMGAFRKP